MIYQVLNEAGNPASTYNNPSALFLNKADAEDYVIDLVDECDIPEETLTIVPYKD